MSPLILVSSAYICCKKLCAGPVLGLSSNVKSSLYVTFREGGALVIITGESSGIPTIGSFVAQSLQHLPFQDLDRENPL
jgi:hypothetical protein